MKCPTCARELKARYRHKAWITDGPSKRWITCPGWILNPEPGPNHACLPAYMRTYNSWNPLFADDMMVFGPSHYLQILEDTIVRCLACGEMWAEEG